MKNFFSTLLVFLPLGMLLGNPVTIEYNFEWFAQPERFTIHGKQIERYTFNGAVHSDEYPALSFLIRRFPVAGPGKLRVRVQEAQYEPVAMAIGPDADFLSENLKFETEILKGREGYFGKLTFSPVIKNGNSYQRLTSIKLVVDYTPGAQPIVYRDPVLTSALADGEVFKIAVPENGVYKITYDFLKNELEMDVDNIDPRQLKLYGNGGGRLPTYVETERIDDLKENNIVVIGESDGSFDASDYILFYGEGPHEWQLDQTNGLFNFIPNIYDTRNYYFLKISSGNGLRVQEQQSLNTTAHTTTTFNDYDCLNEEKVNLLHDWVQSQGSGQRWYGDFFKVSRNKNYDQFSFPGLVTDAAVNVKSVMALRSNRDSYFELKINGQTLTSSTAFDVNLEDPTVPYASLATINDNLLLNSGAINLTLNYPLPSGAETSEGWLDYIQFNVRRNLSVSGKQMAFCDLETQEYGTSTFRVSNVGNQIEIWDITDPIHPRLQRGSQSGNQFSFGLTTDGELRQFIAFDSQEGLLTPEAVGAVENQNIHGIDGVDLIILYPAIFEAEAERLAEHRRNHSNLVVETVRIDQVYNEFASGRKDPTAIRDFAKLLYDRTNRFKYLLLFGDGSFDARDVYGLGNDHIPVFEEDSLNPIYSFPSDDYFGLFSGTSANDPLKGELGIAIGRLPVNTEDQARNVVDKIIHYDTSEDAMRDWRNQMIYVGDDEDGSLHAPAADNIANLINNMEPAFNNNKIYLDAYPQVSTPGGDRFPKATDAINASIFKGALAITYLGHGGSKGWAQERVLNVSDINSWTNYEKMPLFITATCSFAGYDDAGFTSAGEEVFLNPKGGGIALFTTVRAVFASSNARLTEEALRKVVDREILNRPLTLGEVMQYAKNDFTGGSVVTNSRKFALIGDPSQYLALPRYGVKTTRIDQEQVQTGIQDTLRALQQVVVEGEIVGDNDQILENFNGIIYPTIFDKKTVNYTLEQDDDSPKNFDFTVQNNVIFKGRASVANGRFTFTFVVPKDINYQYGRGKISYYAADVSQLIDAAGSYEEIVIGGTNPNAVADGVGPKVEVYMNTQDFVFGGITDPDPTLLVKLEDDYGINVVGNSIGHDLEGTLDNNTQNTYLLNDFYESELDDYTKGEVRYPLSDLEEGRHEIRVKAWDIANNSAEGYTEFVVASSEGIALEHVLNYPNPFTDYTCFQFDHNLANQELEVLINIYTISGRMVKTLEASILSDGAIRRDDCIEWNGKDDFGDQLAKGIYLYKVQVRTAGTGNTVLNGESEFEKLVILK